MRNLLLCQFIMTDTLLLYVLQMQNEMAAKKKGGKKK